MNYCNQGGILLCEMSLRQRTSAQPFNTKTALFLPKGTSSFVEMPFKSVANLARNEVASFCREFIVPARTIYLQEKWQTVMQLVHFV